MIKESLDVLLSSGEQVTCALLAGSLKKLNINSKSWMNWQIPILTEGEHTNARIINMNINKINKFLNEGVAIVPGFKGFQKKEILQQLVEEDRMQLLWHSQKFLMLIVVKFILM